MEATFMIDRLTFSCSAACAEREGTFLSLALSGTLSYETLFTKASSLKVLWLPSVKFLRFNVESVAVLVLSRSIVCSVYQSVRWYLIRVRCSRVMTVVVLCNVCVCHKMQFRIWCSVYAWLLQFSWAGGLCVCCVHAYYANACRMKFRHNVISSCQPVMASF